MERELSDNNAALEEANSNYGRAEDALEDMNREMDDVTDSADDMGDEIDDAGDAAEKSEEKFKGLGTVLKSVGAALARSWWPPEQPR
jgi:phage-related minor tail protein